MRSSRLRRCWTRSASRPSAASNAQAIARCVPARQKQAKFEAFERAPVDDAPIKPERVVATLQALLPRDAIVVADPGTPCPYFSAYYELRGAGRHFISNRAHGALGYALAGRGRRALRPPGVKTVAVMGDGSFGMCVGELETVVRLKLPLTLHRDLERDLRLDQGRPEVRLSGALFLGRLRRTDHARVAAAFGVKSWRGGWRTPASSRACLRQASLTAARPWSTSSPSRCTRRGAGIAMDGLGREARCARARV